jgi:hypothetical protein
MKELTFVLCYTLLLTTAFLISNVEIEEVTQVITGSL